MDSPFRRTSTCTKVGSTGSSISWKWWMELCDVAVLPSACVYVDASYALPTVLVEGEWQGKCAWTKGFVRTLEDHAAFLLFIKSSNRPKQRPLFSDFDAAQLSRAVRWWKRMIILVRVTFGTKYVFPLFETIGCFCFFLKNILLFNVKLCTNIVLHDCTLFYPYIFVFQFFMHLKVQEQSWIFSSPTVAC